MLTIAKLTVKNQLTLPQKIVSRYPDTVHFSVEEIGGRIILEPMSPTSLGKVRDKLAALGVSESDVTEAVKWSRKRK